MRDGREGVYGTADYRDDEETGSSGGTGDKTGCFGRPAVDGVRDHEDLRFVDAEKRVNGTATYNDGDNAKGGEGDERDAQLGGGEEAEVRGATGNYTDLHLHFEDGGGSVRGGAVYGCMVYGRAVSCRWGGTGREDGCSRERGLRRR